MIKNRTKSSAQRARAKRDGMAGATMARGAAQLAALPEQRAAEIRSRRRSRRLRRQVERARQRTMGGSA